MTQWFSFHFQKFSPIPWVSFLFCWLCPLIHTSFKLKNLLEYSCFTMLCFCCTVEWISYTYTFLLFGCSVVSDSLPPHGLQYTRLPCHSPSPRACSNSVSIKSVMPSNHLILRHPLLLLPSIFPSIKVFSNESVLHIRWPKYWSFSFSIGPSSEYSGLTYWGPGKEFSQVTELFYIPINNV